jgi:hypothetical protein
MPALYPSHPCQACNGIHDLYYPGIGAVPDLSKPLFFTCPRLPVAMRVTAGDRWKPVREKPERATEVRYGDEAERAEG